MSKRKANSGRSVFLKYADDKQHSDVTEEAIGQSIKQNYNTGYTHKDSFANPGARTGWGQPNLINMTEYPMTRLTQNWSLLLSLYRSSWIIQQVCSVIPEDCLTDMHIEAPKLDNEQQTSIEQVLNKTRVRQSIIEAMKWARLFGGAAAIIMVEGQEDDMSTPLSIRDILPGSFRGLFVVDRWSGIYPSLELVTNRRSADYGLPKYYEVRDESGVLKYRVHHSRVIRFIGEQMPYYESLMEQQWGTSSIEALYDSVVGHDNVFFNIANLTFKACLSVFEVDGLDQIFASASANAQKRMYSMIEAMSVLESNLGVRMVNKGDSVQQLQYSFSGLPEVLDLFMLEVAGATKIPATRLFGRAPAGMNSTGESDAKNYRLTLEQARAQSVMPALDKLMPIICKSAIGKVPFGAIWKLPTLIESTPSEKYQMVDQQSQLLERLFQANLIPADAVLEGVRIAQRDQDFTSPFTDLIIDKVRGKYMKDMENNADPYSGMAPESGAGVAETESESNESESTTEPDKSENRESEQNNEPENDESEQNDGEEKETEVSEPNELLEKNKDKEKIVENDKAKSDEEEQTKKEEKRISKLPKNSRPKKTKETKQTKPPFLTKKPKEIKPVKLPKIGENIVKPYWRT